MLMLKISFAELAMVGLAACMMTRTGDLGIGVSVPKMEHETAANEDPKVMPNGAKSIVVAGGCFWCIEALYDELKGVYWAESGYAGGAKPNPTYEQVCMGGTGHAEAVKIVYDPEKVSGADLLRYFFALHDPTTLNRQGPDSGNQYRSTVFYANDEEKALATKIRDEIAQSGLWKNPIVTTIEPLKNYSRAEEYHQDYFVKYEKATPAERMRMNAGYCSAIIEPKVRKFREKFAAMLKKNS
jgi:peptide-methionine (S)-S-oxide reductase